jgi:putative addiction module antidote
MELNRQLRRVGGSVVIAIPPEMLEEAGLAEGDEVTLRSRGGVIEVSAQAPDLDPEFVQWVYRTLRKHDAAWRELADL